MDLLTVWRTKMKHWNTYSFRASRSCTCEFNALILKEKRRPHSIYENEYKILCYDIASVYTPERDVNREIEREKNY